MQGTEQRLSRLEGQTHEFTVMTEGVRNDLAEMKTEMTRWFELIDRRFDGVDRRFEQVDQRFDTIDQRFEQVDQRFEALDQRLALNDKRLDRIETRLDIVEDRMSRFFMWTVSLQVMTLAAIVTSLATLLGRL